MTDPSKSRISCDWCGAEVESARLPDPVYENVNRAGGDARAKERWHLAPCGHLSAFTIARLKQGPHVVDE